MELQKETSMGLAKLFMDRKASIGKALADNSVYGRCDVESIRCDVEFDVTSNPFDVMLAPVRMTATMVGGIKALFLKAASIIYAPVIGISIMEKAFGEAPPVFV
jgi:hypothetical protein